MDDDVDMSTDTGDSGSSDISDDSSSDFGDSYDDTDIDTDDIDEDVSDEEVDDTDDDTDELDDIDEDASDEELDNTDTDTDELDEIDEDVSDEELDDTDADTDELDEIDEDVSDEELNDTDADTDELDEIDEDVSDEEFDDTNADTDELDEVDEDVSENEMDDTELEEPELTEDTDDMAADDQADTVEDTADTNTEEPEMTEDTDNTADDEADTAEDTADTDTEEPEMTEDTDDTADDDEVDTAEDTADTDTEEPEMTEDTDDTATDDEADTAEGTADTDAEEPEMTEDTGEISDEENDSTETQPKHSFKDWVNPQNYDEDGRYIGEKQDFGYKPHIDGQEVDTSTYKDYVEQQAASSVTEYMSKHGYGRDDFATYSQDPEWRNLMRKEYPDYELPELTQESAKSQLSDYMNSHNYGQDDFDTYSQDPVWRELQSAAYPDYELPPEKQELFGLSKAERQEIKDKRYINDVILPNADTQMREHIHNNGLDKYISDDKLKIKCTDNTEALTPKEMHAKYGKGWDKSIMGFNDGNRSFVDSSYGYDQAKETAIHENFHQLSANDTNNGWYTTYKRGLSIDGADRGLNEAMTQKYTLDTMRDTDPSYENPNCAYDDATKLVQDIYSFGDNKDMFDQAYFGNKPELLKQHFDKYGGEGFYDRLSKNFDTATDNRYSFAERNSSLDSIRDMINDYKFNRLMEKK